MNQLLEIHDYQKRQEFMENNTVILTTLFEKEMQNYIYQEATQLVQVESQLAGNVRLTLMAMCGVLLVTMLLLLIALPVTYSITKPISEILHNIKKVGKGEYKNIAPVIADCIEIQELDEGTRKMAGRIEGLLENVRKEQDAQHLTELQLLQAQVNPQFSLQYAGYHCLAGRRRHGAGCGGYDHQPFGFFSVLPCQREKILFRWLRRNAIR